MPCPEPRGEAVRRREFIKVFVGTATAWPLTARAQQPRAVIGFLSSVSPDAYSDRLCALRQGLKEVGYVEGQNVQIEYRWAEGRNDQLASLAAELVRQQVAVIVAAGGTPSALAAKAATATIPIVFAIAVDPVEIGLVTSVNPRGQPDGRDQFECGNRTKAVGAATRIGARGDHGYRAC
jgi:putative ABC transport system substrate-binding protein